MFLTLQRQGTTPKILRLELWGTKQKYNKINSKLIFFLISFLHVRAKHFYCIIFELKYL